MIFPAPDFLVEILSRSTAKNDRTIKHQDYAAHRIRKYWIIDPNRQLIDQFILIGNDTEYMPAKTHLISQDIKSFVIEDFEIPVAAIFDEQINKTTLQDMKRHQRRPGRKGQKYFDEFPKPIKPNKNTWLKPSP
jgi:hypothetical protein